MACSGRTPAAASPLTKSPEAGADGTVGTPGTCGTDGTCGVGSGTGRQRGFDAVGVQTVHDPRSGGHVGGDRTRPICASLTALLARPVVSVTLPAWPRASPTTPPTLPVGRAPVGSCPVGSVFVGRPFSGMPWVGSLPMTVCVTPSVVSRTVPVTSSTVSVTPPSSAFSTAPVTVSEETGSSAALAPAVPSAHIPEAAAATMRERRMLLRMMTKSFEFTGSWGSGRPVHPRVAGHGLCRRMEGLP